MIKFLNIFVHFQLAVLAHFKMLIKQYVLQLKVMETEQPDQRIQHTLTRGELIESCSKNRLDE